MQQLACKFHKDAELIEDYRAGDIICRVCALVVGERYDYFINSLFSALYPFFSF